MCIYLPHMQQIHGKNNYKLVIQIRVQRVTFISNERTESMRVSQKLKWSHHVKKFGNHYAKLIAPPL
jgi:hypothetical protein